MECETKDGWKKVQEPPEWFLEVNEKAKELRDLLKVQYPEGCLTTIKTFNTESETGPYWVFHIESTPE